MSRSELNPGAEWERGWEGHERAQRRRLAQLSMIEKLAWLEEAHRVVRHLGAAREERREDRDSSSPE